MKKFLLGTLGLVAMAAPALAADLPVKAPPPPVLPPMYNWSGFYIGANGGWAESDVCWDLIAAGVALVANSCHERSGGVIGGQIGYRWQQPGNHFVLGLEAQGDWANIRNSQVSLFDPTLTLSSKIDAIGLFTGQFGFAWDTWLWYVKGGAAVTDNKFFINSTATGVGLASLGSDRWGGVVGTGFEYGFGGGWSVGLEYDHLFMGSEDNTFVTPALAGTISRNKQDVDMLTLRFNYRFGFGGAPLVARY